MAQPRTPAMDRLFDAVLTLQSREDCYRFFEDLCTIKEVQDMAGRFEAALLLEEGKNYNQIAAQAGISTATIGRVSRALNYGSGGYRDIIARLQEGEDSK